MKEASFQEIRKIEDRELRSLARYEYLMVWGKSGALSKAAEAYHAQIAEAARVQAVAELRVAQINVIEKTVAKFDAPGSPLRPDRRGRSKTMCHAAERQAIQEAVDEVMALEEIIPADDIDDILSEVSKALGIELPTDADRADICQRGFKSMDDLKRRWDVRVESADDPA
ncbi:hypothetical protein ACL2DZ_00280 (plasmid) [Sinorhizobium meliloti]